MVERNVAAKVQHGVERGSHSELRFIVDRAICTATMKEDVCQMRKQGTPPVRVERCRPQKQIEVGQSTELKYG
jgi:hypothetical protein